MNATLESMTELLRQTDTFAVVERLTAIDPPLQAARLFAELMRHAYWQRKDLPATIAIGRAGAQYCLSMALHAPAETANELRGIAKGLTYDIASFTWSGWDEPGIACGAGDITIGLDAARANLRLAGELGRGELPQSRAWWMLAAQQLATGSPGDAETGFERAAQLAASANAPGEELLSKGFAALSRILAGGSHGFEADLATIDANLRALPDGEFLADQIVTARRVFERQSENS